MLANGAAGQVLQSNGTTLAPTWTSAPAGLAAATATTATNIAGGTGGAVHYQSAANTTALLANGTAGQVLQSNGTTLAPTWTSAPAGLAATTATTANTATTATNLAGGFGGAVPYQSAANTTALLANGTAGQVLQSNGTTLAPTWTSAPAGLAAATATTATTATNIAGGTGGAVHYQIAANQTGLLANGVVGTVLQSAGGTLAPRWTTEVPLATSLAGGAGGSIPYQTTANQTALLPNGTINMVLQSNGGTNPPSWTGNPVFGLASNIAGGSGGSIPYQTGTNATSMVANGTVGSVLKSNGGVAAPSWVSAAPLATSIAGGLGGALPYQSAANATALLANGTAGQVLQSGGGTAAPSWTSSPAGLSATYLSMNNQTFGNFNLMFCTGTSGLLSPNASSKLMFSAGTGTLSATTMNTTNALISTDQNAVTNNGAEVFSSVHTLGAQTYLSAYNSASPAVNIVSFNASGANTSTNPANGTNLLILKPYELPVFTYGPVCYGRVPAAGSSVTAPYFLSPGFTYSSFQGVTTITWTTGTFVNPIATANVIDIVVGVQNSCQVSHQTSEGTANTIVFKCWRETSASNSLLTAVGYPFQFVIYSGVGATYW
jgi:hypothetical protein